ncbi:MAG: FtsW/RodA/SpoVE family cell cycle protein [Oscillospiraceae bacterium]|nr:FtsW/RodA/SpoVE family cell cycle protein [Oscillospiraceae bacterium]
MDGMTMVMENLALGWGFVSVTRFCVPLLALWILLRCARSMLRMRYEPEVWGYLKLPNGKRCPLLHWENLLGRAGSSDIVVPYPAVSRVHAALIRSDNGTWTVRDLRSTGGVYVNGKRVKSSELRDGDVLRLADQELDFLSLTESERGELSGVRAQPGDLVRPGLNFLLLTLLLAILGGQQLVSAQAEYRLHILLAYAAFALVMWSYFLVMRSIRRSGFEVETIAFFLSAIGLSVAAGSVPEALLKHLLLLIGGIVLFILLGWWLRDLRRTRALRWVCGFAALGFLALNLFTAEEVFGARNWLYIAGFSVQPSEFVKVAYIYAGAATLERLYSGRNLFLFIAFSALCVGALALMGDFGTALVFFATFLVISFLRSGNLATVFLAVSGAALACFLVLYAKPHIAARFATWGHIWETPYGAGFQQTRALAAAASGGLLGCGAGAGWLKDVVAADTDLVFCLICEEFGLLTAVLAILAIVLLATFAYRNAAGSRSSFYVIGACAAVSLMMVQLALNVFGSTDILPFTGVTFPFVSRGGSSLISCWMLLAFIKAADTRQNASFAQKLPSGILSEPVDEDEEDGE